MEPGHMELFMVMKDSKLEDEFYTAVVMTVIK